MDIAIEILLTRTWWKYDPAGDWTQDLTRYFNLFEATCWFLFAAAVLLRWSRYRKSTREWVYAGLFITFGATDMREAFVLQSWLIWIKAFNLVSLFALRRWLIHTHYPNSRTY